MRTFPFGWTTLGNFMPGSTTTLGKDTYGVVVVGKTVEAFTALRTGEQSGTLGVVVEIIDIAKGRGGGHKYNGYGGDRFFFLGEERVAGVVIFVGAFVSSSSSSLVQHA
jgi:hypothetical protein